MGKFKINNKSEIKVDLYFYGVFKGSTGTIMSKLLDYGAYAVELDFNDYDNRRISECNGLVPSGRGILVEPEYLKKEYGKRGEDDIWLNPFKCLVRGGSW